MSGTQKNCARCKKAFTCNQDDIAACDCTRISLSNETRTFLTKTFYGCLCNDCLAVVDGLVKQAKEYPFPGPGGELKEGIHYYREGVYRVFTELYHVSRGYCCRSGCRHCAYGFKRRYAE